VNTIQKKAIMENFDLLMDFIEKNTEQAGFNERTAKKIRLACEEVILNVINYAYEPGRAGDIKLMARKMGEEIEIRLTDWGVPFNPLTTEDPEIDVPVHERKIGGLGIFLVKKIMDTVTYRRDGEKNILILKKMII
jgi:serine/threonine-protein kinase RsbW